MMAPYFARKIMEGKTTYAFVFSVQVYKQYQDDVDAILIAEGKADLIPEDRLPKK